jgi:DNA repair protein RadC
MKTQLPSTAVFSSSQIEIHYKRPLFDSMMYIRESKDAVRIAREFSNEHQLDLKEFFWVLYLTNANRLLGIHEISIGTTISTVIGVKEVFQGALLTNAVGIILVHNHPSGSLKFSISDKQLSAKVFHLAKYMEVTLLDHIVITSESFNSLADEGFFFNL